MITLTLPLVKSITYRVSKAASLKKTETLEKFSKAYGEQNYRAFKAKIERESPSTTFEKLFKAIYKTSQLSFGKINEILYSEKQITDAMIQEALERQEQENEFYTHLAEEEQERIAQEMQHEYEQGIQEEHGHLIAEAIEKQEQEEAYYEHLAEQEHEEKYGHLIAEAEQSENYWSVQARTFYQKATKLFANISTLIYGWQVEERIPREPFSVWHAAASKSTDANIIDLVIENPQIFLKLISTVEEALTRIEEIQHVDYKEELLKSIDYFQKQFFDMGSKERKILNESLSSYMEIATKQ